MCSQSRRASLSSRAEVTGAGRSCTCLCRVRSGLQGGLCLGSFWFLPFVLCVFFLALFPSAAQFSPLLSSPLFHFISYSAFSPPAALLFLLLSLSLPLTSPLPLPHARCVACSFCRLSRPRPSLPQVRRRRRIGDLVSHVSRVPALCSLLLTGNASASA